MKYKTIIETDEFENFEFFEDGNGKYIHGIDAGAINNEWIPLYFKECEQEPCEDTISRQAVLDLVVTNHTELNGVNVVMYSPFCKDIKQLSPVTPKAKSDVLDKIRDEIEEMYYIDEGLSFDPQISREDVLKIIDKYRESEG